MGTHVMVFGDLTLPRGAGRALGRQPADPSQWRDWPEAMAAESAQHTVGELIERIPSWPDDAGRIVATLDGDCLTIRGVLAEDSFYDMASALGAVFRVAATLGGHGALAFVEWQGAYGYVVEVRPGRSRVIVARGKRLRQLVSGKGYAEADRAAGERH